MWDLKGNRNPSNCGVTKPKRVGGKEVAKRKGKLKRSLHLKEFKFEGIS